MQIGGNLGNQHGIGTHGDACLQRQPAGLLSQDLHHGHLPCRLGRLAGLVEHLDGEAEGGVEAEGHLGGGNVVLDGPGNADRVEPFAVELVHDAQPPAAHDGNQRVDPFRLQPPEQLIRHVHFLDHFVFVDLADMKRIDAGRLAQDATGSRVQVLDQLRAERNQPALGVTFRMQQSVKSIADADHLPSQLARQPGPRPSPRH